MPSADAPVFDVGLIDQEFANRYRDALSQASACFGIEVINPEHLCTIPLSYPRIKVLVMDGAQCLLDQDQLERTGLPLIILNQVDGTAKQELLAWARGHRVYSVLTEPVWIPDLVAAIQLAEARFSELCLQKEEADELRKALANRKIIERAKALMIKHLGIEEPEAFRRLQKLASSKNMKLVDLAQMIVSAAEEISG